MSEEKKELDRIRSTAYTLFEHTYTAALAHFSSADGWAWWHKRGGVASIIFSAIAGSSLLTRSQELELLAGILSIAVTIIVSISTLLNPGKTSQEHFNAGTSYQDLKNDVQLFYEIESLREDGNNDQLISELNKLSKKRDELDKKCPRIKRKKWIEAVEASKDEIKRTGIKPPQNHARATNLP